MAGHATNLYVGVAARGPRIRARSKTASPSRWCSLTSLNFPAAEARRRLSEFPFRTMMVATGAGSIPTGPSTIARTYPYTDAAGQRAVRKVRYVPKDFRLRRPDGAGGWTWNLKGIARVLYRLDELAEQPEIHVAEGEDDTDVLRTLGYIATTNDAGADGWRASHTAELVRMGPAIVYLHEDHDAAGRARVATIAPALAAAGIEVRHVRYTDCGPGGDVRAALERDGAEALRARIAAAPCGRRTAASRDRAPAETP